MDQENLCLRTSDCNNSNVGEQTLGNDNSITGFADQSKNVQAVITPTPVVTPTPTPSNCNGIEDDNNPGVEINEHTVTGLTDPDATQPPGVVCPPGEDEPSSQESAEQTADGREPVGSMG